MKAGKYNVFTVMAWGIPWSRIQLELAEDGIAFTYSTTASQQQNGASERLNQTLLNKAHSMLAGSQLHKKYWTEAVLHANYLRNVSPVASLSTTPYEAATGRKPDLNHLRVLGCSIRN